MTLTREGLEEALKLAGAATPGPWTVFDDECGGEVEFPEGGSANVSAGDDRETSDFIAFSREAVPAMAQALLRVYAVCDSDANDSPEYERALSDVRAALLGSDEAR